MVQAIKRDEVYIEPEGIYVETHQPERRSRKPPLLLVHGVLTGSWLWSGFAAFFAERGWEAHAMNFRGHYTSDLADLATTSMRDFADDIGVATRQLGRPPVVIAWGMGALAPARSNVPSLVIGAGLDDVIHPSEARMTADLLGGTYEYFASASHFGLVMGSATWPEVAGSVLGWLEERRHAMNAVLAGAGSGVGR